jgi:beta-phosphoglucomutase
MEDNMESADHKVILDLHGIKAAIFDMDGTMINNMAYHKKAWIEFCNRHGLSLTEDEFKEKFSGKKNNQILETVFGKTLSPEEIVQYTDEKEHIYQELYTSDIEEVPGLAKILEDLKSRNIKLAIATTAPETNRQFGLEALGLTDSFEVILGDEHVTRGKPDPEIYVETAKQLGVDSSQCVVFEDSPVGVEAGKNAGIKVVGLLTTHSNEELAQADLHVRDFTQIELQ